MLLEMSAEDPLALVESFSTQIFQEDVLPLTSRDFAAVVDSVTTEDVNQVCFSVFFIRTIENKKIHTIMVWIQTALSSALSLFTVCVCVLQLQVARQLLSGKMSMAAVGNLVQTPYLDELIWTARQFSSVNLNSTETYVDDLL